MTSGETPSTASEGKIPKTRSFPNLVASLLFNHNVRSPATTDHIPQTSNRLLTIDDDQPSSGSTAISVSGFLGSPFEQDSFYLDDNDINIHRSSSSTTLKRRSSEQWTTSFLRANDLSQNASGSPNETSAGSGGRRISAPGSTNIMALQQSLSDIFSPNKVIIDARQETREVATQSVSKVYVSPPQSSTPQLSTASSPDVSKAAATPAAIQSGLPHPKATLRRQWSLDAVLESDPTREEVPPQSSVPPNIGDRRMKARTSVSAAPRETSIDENQNIVGPVVLDSSQRQSHSVGAIEMAARELTSQDHVMEVPNTVAGRPSRRFGIMEMMGAGEKKKVRNKDVNMMAPQSW